MGPLNSGQNGGTNDDKGKDCNYLGSGDYSPEKAGVGRFNSVPCHHHSKELGRFRPLSLPGEFFNIFIHPNFGPADNNITDALFGYSTATLASSLGSGGANGDH